MKFLIIFALLLSSCGSKSSPKDPLFISQNVVDKAGLYRSLHEGWAHDKCDSLGFTSLCKLAGGCKKADIFQAEGEPGRWYRSPEKDCYDKGESNSDISKDMFVMLLPYLYLNKHKDDLREIRDYALSNNLVMGRGERSRVIMAIDMLGLIQDMLMTRTLNTAMTVEEITFRDHLDVIWAITVAATKGGIYRNHLEQIRQLKNRNPRNALFQAVFHRYTDGNQEETIKILGDESLFPSNRLPTSSDRCEEYLWQRDEDSDDWKPCDKGKIHSGTDFIFAAWIAGLI